MGLVLLLDGIHVLPEMLLQKEGPCRSQCCHEASNLSALRRAWAISKSFIISFSIKKPTVYGFLGLFIFILWVWVFCLHVRKCTTCIGCLVPMETRKCQVLWNRSYRWLWAPTWVLGTKSESSARVASVLNCWAVSIIPDFYFKSRFPCTFSWNNTCF